MGPGRLPTLALVVDDNDVNLMVLNGFLAALGVPADLLSNGAAAVAARPDADYDVLLIDITMPGMDGLATLRAIRAEEAARGLPRAAAVAVTGNVMADQVHAYLEAGFDAHLPKPIGRDVLLASLERVMAQG
jgi:CheY-like chemotaxis protein